MIVMAGMLPGVECARRRRFHLAGVVDAPQNIFCRRSHLPISDSSQDLGSVIRQATRPRSEFQPENSGDNKLHEVAREARNRLEGRLRALSSSSVNRRNYRQRRLQQDNGNTYDEEHGGINNRGLYSGLITDSSQPREIVAQNVNSSPTCLSKACIDLLRREIYSPPTIKGKSLVRILSRTSAQDDCSICLEFFQINQELIRLPCGHKFHSSCLIPWLEKDNHCPYCRAQVSIKAS